LHIFTFVSRKIVLCRRGFRCMELIKTKKSEFIHSTLNSLR
jgi:hypothetical protein